MPETRGSMRTDKLFSRMPTSRVQLPIVNQFVCTCINGLFHMALKINREQSRLIAMLVIAKTPLLVNLPGIKILIKKVSNGMITAKRDRKTICCVINILKISLSAGQ